MHQPKQAPPRFTRLLRRLNGTRAMARRAFPSATLTAIQAAIGAGEQGHRAQVRMIIEAALSWGAAWRGDSARARAHVLFSHYRIWDTEENCGVLVYVNLAEHKVEIIADRGIARHVSNTQWQAVCATLASACARGDYHDGSLAALAQLHQLLDAAMPRAAGTSGDNELSDKPVLL